MTTRRLTANGALRYRDKRRKRQETASKIHGRGLAEHDFRQIDFRIYLTIVMRALRGGPV